MDVDVQRTFANLEEDVETEDAWEVASRRASVLSRRPSNHSIRVPTNTEQPEASTTTGEPSTEIGIGAAARSVEQLLAGDGASMSDEGMDGSQPLQRQTTAVQENVAPTIGVVGPEGAIPSPVREEDEPMTSTLVDSNAAPEHAEGQPIPSLTIDPFGEAMSEAQTPMNDSFLANLAPSVHQRLDLARQMGEVARAATPVEEEPGMDADPENASPSDDSWQQIDRERTPAEVEAARRDMEMMFT